jgi:hypothetical protein
LKQAVTFLKKSNQKTFAPLRAARDRNSPAPREAEQKFLRRTRGGAFFKKRVLL